MTIHCLCEEKKMYKRLNIIKEREREREKEREERGGGREILLQLAGLLYSIRDICFMIFQVE